MCLERKRYVGLLTCGDAQFEIAFACWADEDFRLQLEAEPISRELYLHVARTSPDIGSMSVLMVLEGTSEDGWSFHSDRVTERGFGFGAEYRVTFRAQIATISIPSDRPPEASPVKRVWLRGYASHRGPDVQTPLGVLRVTGAPRPASQDAVSGEILLEAQESADGWSAAADDFLTFVQLGLAFGQGSRLQSPRQEFWSDGINRATYVDGTTFPNHLSPILPLNQGPYIEAVAQRFFREPPFPDMLWTAIGWLQAGSTIGDVEFLTAMTALETIVEHVAPQAQIRVVSRGDYAPVRDRMIEVLQESALTDDAKAIFAEKIRMLNRRELVQKLEALRDHYGLSDERFDRASISEAIRIRNDLVHTGVNTQNLDVWPRVMFVRDLVALIVFAEMGYGGPYQTFHGGRRTAPAPGQEN